MQSIIANFLSDIFVAEDKTLLGRLMPWFAGGIVAFVAFPWVMMVLYGLYYGIFLRPTEQAAMALSPLLTFLFFLTDKDTPGSDQRLMRLFHPSLLEEERDGGSVQRGLIRAMSRCLVDTFGKVTSISRDTAVLTREGNNVQCVALIDFEKVKQVRCQLSWKRRPGVVKRYRQEAGRYPARSEKESFVLDGIGIALPYTFQVTSFHIDPQKGDEFDILEYVRLVDFDDVGELCVRRLFEKPPRAAVSMMAQPLKEIYSSEESLATLQESVQKVVEACGGLASSPDTVDVDQTSYKAIYAPQREAAAPLTGAPQKAKEENDRTASAIVGVDMVHLVKGNSCDVEVRLRLTFSGLRALVDRYEVRLLPDGRPQVLVVHDVRDPILVG
ncbi:hypothetical protein LSCM1_05420 [Leishmania martiniquensis]|uniref:Uncharacterized protein n=1 Tax=Leishmania martiniquensis TaxID=1580590 RepID=A0A836KIF9_9TRYP|nr:hypothetical protein LSCM1_05420 [Leishmania martiniquensis]